MLLLSNEKEVSTEHGCSTLRSYESVSTHRLTMESHSPQSALYQKDEVYVKECKPQSGCKAADIAFSISLRDIPSVSLIRERYLSICLL